MVSKKILHLWVQKTLVQKTWNSCRFWFNQYWPFKFQQTIWLIRNIFGLWQQQQTHNNLWQLQHWITSKIHKICKADKLSRYIQPDKWNKIWHGQFDPKPFVIQTICHLDLQWLQYCTINRLYKYLFVITWKPLLYQPWCSWTFNQIYMGSH